MKLNLIGYKAQKTPEKCPYTSKLIADLMNSNSSDGSIKSKQQSYDYTEYLDGHERYNRPETKERNGLLKYANQGQKLFPTFSSSHQKVKENIPADANHSREAIRYNCYKINGDRLIEHSNGYNTLQEASMIPIQNQEENQSNLINNPFAPLFKSNKNHEEKSERYRSKMSTTTKATEKQMDAMVSKYEKKIRQLQRQLKLCQQELQVKDKYYEDLSVKLEQKKKELKQKERQLIELNKQNKHIKQKQQRLEKELADFYSTQHDTRQVYEEVAQYIQKLVHENKNKLVQHKMSPFVEDILQEFMTELLNINKITVSRSKSRTIKFDSTPNKDSLSFVSENNRKSAIMTVTPQREKNSKIEKSQELRDLEKSVQKLRDMEKQYTPQKNNKYSTVTNYHAQVVGDERGYNTSIPQQYLDRSSLLLDRSVNRSKSRRKKIFDRV